MSQGSRENGSRLRVIKFSPLIKSIRLSATFWPQGCPNGACGRPDKISETNEFSTDCKTSSTGLPYGGSDTVSYTHLRAHETLSDL
eukprot:1553200-Karenia_brevis.AAC.1